jgi:hypothetical protein
VNKQTITTIPAAVDPVSLFTAEHAVHMIYETSIPMPDQVNKVLRPKRSTMNAAENAAAKLKI